MRNEPFEVGDLIATAYKPESFALVLSAQKLLTTPEYFGINKTKMRWEYKVFWIQHMFATTLGEDEHFTLNEFGMFLVSSVRG